MMTDDDRDWQPTAAADFSEGAKPCPEPAHKAEQVAEGFLERHALLICGIGVVGFLALSVATFVFTPVTWSDFAWGLFAFAVGFWMIAGAIGCNIDYRSTNKGPVQSAEVVSVVGRGEGAGYDCVVKIGDKEYPLYTHSRIPRGTIQVARVDGDGELIWRDPWERRITVWGWGGFGVLLAIFGVAMMAGLLTES
jgi:hypothetical protein